MTPEPEPLFQVPESEWRRRRCPVCGGALKVQSTHTYAMQRQGWVKIGASNHPAERLGVLRRSSPGCLVRFPEGMDLSRPIVLLGVLKGPEWEHHLHVQFQESHAVGEWFLPQGAMAEWLASEPLLTLEQAGLPLTATRKRTP